jgi:hypothetical protein
LSPFSWKNDGLVGVVMFEEVTAAFALDTPTIAVETSAASPIPARARRLLSMCPS